MNEKRHPSLKRWGCLSGLVVLFLLLVLLAWVSRDAVPPLRHIPANASQVFRLTDLNGLWVQLESHPCLTQLPKEVKASLLDQMKFLKDLKPPLGPVTRGKVNLIAGKEVVFAQMAGQPVFATRVHPLIKIAELVARKSGQFKVENSEGWVLRSVDVGKGQQLFFVLLSRTFYGSMDKAALLECLKTKEPMEKDKVYAEAVKAAAPHFLEAILRFDQMIPGMDKAPAGPGKGILFLSLGKEGDLHLSGNAEMIGTRKALLDKMSPGTMEVFKRLPKDSLIVLASDWSQPMKQAFATLSELLDNKALDPKNLDPSIMDMAQLMGYNVQGDFIDAAQEEFGLVVQDLDVNEVVPLPELALFMKSSKANAGFDVLARTIKDLVLEMGVINIPENIKPFLQLDELEVAGHKTYMMANTPFGYAFKPCLSAVGDYVVLSTSRQTLEEMVAMDGKGSSLADREGYGDWDKMTSNLSLFVNIQGITQRVESLAAELAELGLLKDTDVPTFDQKIRPYYDAMQFVDGLLLNLSLKEGQLHIEGTMHFAGPSASKPEQG